MRISVGQDEHGSLSAKQRHARDGIVQTVQVVDFPDDYEKQVGNRGNVGSFTGLIVV